MSLQSGNKKIHNVEKHTYESNDCSGTDTHVEALNTYRTGLDQKGKDALKKNSDLEFPINEYFEKTYTAAEEKDSTTETAKATCEHQKFLTFYMQMGAMTASLVGPPSLSVADILLINAENGKCIGSKQGDKKSSTKYTWEGPCNGELSATDIGLTIVGVFLGLFMIGAIAYIFCFAK